MSQPCGWDPSVCKDCCTAALEGLDPDTLAALSAQAVQFLWAATGKRYGLCEKILRPCRRECNSFWGGLPFPLRISGEWINISCGSCRGRCGCSVLSDFIADNVQSVTGVMIDGESLDPADTVIVYNRRQIVRADNAHWPRCQNLALPDTESGTWSVTVMQGEPVPAGGETMAGILLCELAKACTGDDSCRLPRRVQTITRQGVTVGFQDMFEGLGNMRTGLWEVDAWIESARTTLGRGASISSIDAPRPSVQTWPVLGGGS